MDKFEKTVVCLRLLDNGRNGALSDAADRVEKLLGDLYATQELAERRRKPMRASKPPQPPRTAHKISQKVDLDHFDEIIEYLRLEDGDRNGPLSEAADNIEEMLGDLYAARELAEMCKRVRKPKAKPGDTIYVFPAGVSQRHYQTWLDHSKRDAREKGQSPFFAIGEAIADKDEADQK